MLKRILCAGAVVSVLAGCVPRLAVRPVHYDVDVRIDPGAGSLEGGAAVELELTGPSRRRGRIELELHPDLAVESLELTGARLRRHHSRDGRVEDDGKIVPTVHRLTVAHPRRDIRVDVGYAGVLRQDVAAGEREGEIHNFAVRAHIGEDGLYLGERGYWFPAPALDDDADPELGLADYSLAADPVDGFELVAGLEREDDGDDGRLRWSSPFPLQGLVLLGGPLQRWSRSHGDIELHAVLAPGKDEVARDILDASAEYLDLYQPLIGPYPFGEFTVLEAFFSSGFAFPTCTQIAGSQLSEYRQYRRHGYLDHELLHNWWGNGIFVDPRDGNWCEGLASYMGNYYGHVLEGDEAGARKTRRNQSNLLSAIEPDDDRPLGTFDLEGGAGRGLGYQKGAAVFHMLQRRLGEEAFFAGLRRLTDERMGRLASWDDLRRAFELESGEDLGGFFEQWVRGAGAPQLTLLEARWTPGSEQVGVRISQEPTSFTLEVPLRLHYGARTVDTVVTVDRPVTTVTVPCDADGLTAIELDPDYHVFRRLKPQEIMPTSATTRRASRLLVVVADEAALAEGYRVLLEAYRREIVGDEDDGASPEGEVLVRAVAEVDDAALAASDVLVLGDAVRHPTVRRFLERTASPVGWPEGEAGFAIDERVYGDPGHAVFLTVHHPDLEGHGATVYYGNDDAALANARVLFFYPNSLLVFETPSGPETGVDEATAMPRSAVVQRLDFEFHDRIDF